MAGGADEQPGVRGGGAFEETCGLRLVAQRGDGCFAVGGGVEDGVGLQDERTVVVGGDVALQSGVKLPRLWGERVRRCASGGCGGEREQQGDVVGLLGGVDAVTMQVEQEVEGLAEVSGAGRAVGVAPALGEVLVKGVEQALVMVQGDGTTQRQDDERKEGGRLGREGGAAKEAGEGDAEVGVGLGGRWCDACVGGAVWRVSGGRNGEAVLGEVAAGVGEVVMALLDEGVGQVGVGGAWWELAEGA